MEEIQEVAIPKESQYSEMNQNHGMTKVEGELQSFVEKRLKQLPGVNPNGISYVPVDNYTIFRLPDHELKKELCEPKVVSIGPYHRGKPSLRTMEHHKWFTLRKFLESNSKVDLKSCLQAMKNFEPHARKCYIEPVDLGSDDFALMLLLDGCFILEWLRDFTEGNTYLIIITGWYLRDIFYDLCLMENQIPYRVIHYLMTIREGVEYGTIECSHNVRKSCPLVKLINGVFEKFNKGQIIEFKPLSGCQPIHHLLHFYHWGVAYVNKSDQQGRSHNFCGLNGFPCFKCFTCLSSKPASESTQQTQNDQGKSPNLFRSHCFSCLKLFPTPPKAASDSKKNDDDVVQDIHIMCVSELCDAGVKFKKKKTPKDMRDVSFKNGTIEMPFLKIDSYFVRILWNLVAYEQICYIPEYGSLSSYLALMDSLINIEKDVSILERAGIVDNYFSNAEEAAAYFNQFGKLFVLTYDDHYFIDLFKKIKNYGESTWPKYRARLVQDYFSNPWAIISVVAAMVLFALTILQTYYSAKSV